ncbi:MAG: alpha/beta hydrolase [Candidatus Sericytochromatia bacterium]
MHGVLVDREYMAFFARVLARQGRVALIFDLGGYGESDPRPESESDNLEETLAAIGQLRQLPGVDNNRIALAGHSMGGTAVLQALDADSGLKGGVVLGMEPEATGPVPCKIWFGLGQYEAFHPPGQLRAKLPPPQRGCKVPLFVSPISSHQTEMRDPLLLNAASLWLAEQLHDRHVPAAVWQEFALSLATEAYVWAWGGLVLVLFWQWRHSWGELIFLSGAVGGLLLAGQLHWLPPSQAALLCLGGVFLLSLRTHLQASQAEAWSRTLALLACFWLAHESVTLIHALPLLIQAPAKGLWLPFFLFQEVRVLPQTAVTMLQSLFFERYTQSLEPAWPMAVILALEWLKPGWLMGLSLESGPWLTRRLNAPFEPTPQRWGSLRAGGLLVGLSVFLGVILWQRSASGYLHAGALHMLWQHGCLRVLPTILLALGLFWLYLQKQEQKTGTRPRQDSNLRPTI